MSSVQFQQKQDGASETAQQVKVVAAVKPEDPRSISGTYMVVQEKQSHKPSDFHMHAPKINQMYPRQTKGAGVVA